MNRSIRRIFTSEAADQEIYPMKRLLTLVLLGGLAWSGLAGCGTERKDSLPDPTKELIPGASEISKPFVPGDNPNPPPPFFKNKKKREAPPPMPM
jgi:hypothetical protein